MRNTEFLTLRSVSTNRDLRGCSRSWGGPVWPQAEALPPYVCVPLLTLLASQGTAGRGSPFCSKLCWREVGSSLPDSTAASRSCYCPSSGDLSATQLCGHLSQLLNRASPVTDSCAPWGWFHERAAPHTRALSRLQLLLSSLLMSFLLSHKWDATLLCLVSPETSAAVRAGKSQRSGGRPTWL